MCPMCLAATGAYVAGGVSAGAVTAVVATLWRKRPEPTDRPLPIETRGDDHATTDDRIER